LKVTEHLKNNEGKTLFSIEILPPMKGESIQNIFAALDVLAEFKPLFIDVTYHREEYVYKEIGQGLLKKELTRKRPGTVAICAALMQRYKVDAVPHIICGGFSKEETENALIDLNFLGIDNVLVLRGDPIKSEGIFVPHPEGHRYATDLLGQVKQMNQGKYADTSLQNAIPTDFCIGVAAYPEKHFESPSLPTDMKYLKTKIDMGADYIVTQMFFDNQAFFNFVKKCREIGINVPIIPGLKPITTKGQLSALPRTFHIDMPEDLVLAVEKCKDNEAVKQVGIEWCIQQSKELMQFGVPSLHYYTMSKSMAIKEIASAVF
jgi:methylenetetrahydrofolate reductase (NADPH)